jgi:hypothetical protein
MSETTKYTLMEKLSNIQRRLSVPKTLYNSFSKFNYRSCEGILEAVKPLLSEWSAILLLSDEVIDVGGRVYVKATATLTDASGEVVQVSASAREQEVKKGMDTMQITGCASSYARKYALNGLFAIDDSADADHLDNRESTPDKADQTKNDREYEIRLYQVQKDRLLNWCKEKGATPEDLGGFMRHRYGKTLAELSPEELVTVCDIVEQEFSKYKNEVAK